MLRKRRPRTWTDLYQVMMDFQNEQAYRYMIIDEELNYQLYLTLAAVNRRTVYELPAGVAIAVLDFLETVRLRVDLQLDIDEHMADEALRAELIIGE